jgi:hypothetical protein
VATFGGSVPVAPDAVRVWRGFRNHTLECAEFLAFLGETLFPIEGTWRPNFGLTCYVAGIKSLEASASAPDEFALVFYESQGVYDAGLRTVAGRIYPLFPSPKFESGLSGYPHRLQEAFEKDTPYYLFDNHVDWYHGTVRCLLGVAKPPVDELCAKVHQVLAGVQASPPTGLDGLIAMVDENKDHSGYLLCWEHWADGASPVDGLLASLTGLLDVAFHKDAADPMIVDGGFYDADVSVSPVLKGDQLLRLQFLRRRLAAENGRPVIGPLN